MTSLVHFGYSPFIVQVARAQLALSLCYAHHETNSTSEDGHRVYKVTWTRAFSDVLEDEQDGEADAGHMEADAKLPGACGPVDYGSGESVLTHQPHFASLTECSCNFHRRWGCFCRHMACVYYITNTHTVPEGIMSTAWHVEGSQQDQLRRETFESFLGPDTPPRQQRVGGSQLRPSHCDTTQSCILRRSWRT